SSAPACGLPGRLLHVVAKRLSNDRSWRGRCRNTGKPCKRHQSAGHAEEYAACAEYRARSGSWTSSFPSNRPPKGCLASPYISTDTIVIALEGSLHDLDHLGLSDRLIKQTSISNSVGFSFSKAAK